MAVMCERISEEFQILEQKEQVKIAALIQTSSASVARAGCKGPRSQSGGVYAGRLTFPRPGILQECSHASKS